MSRNDRKKPGLNARQLRAIAALVEEPTIASAATKAGVSQKTLFRWLNNDEAFSEAYEAARGKLLEDVLTSLQGASIQAIKTLIEVMKAEGVSASARVSAAKAVLEMSLKAREILEWDERLTMLEEQLLGHSIRGVQ